MKKLIKFITDPVGIAERTAWIILVIVAATMLLTRTL